MDCELQCWDKETLEDYLERIAPRTRDIALPWVVVSKTGSPSIVEFSSANREEAMGYMLEHLIQMAYAEWEDNIEARFGVSDLVIQQCILKFILLPDERELLSDFYPGGLLFKCEEGIDQTSKNGGD